MMRSRIVVSALIICCLAISSVGARPESPPTPPAVAAGDWPATGRDANNQHFSPLEEINPATIARLGLAWSFDIPGTVLATSTPVAANGILYFTTGYSIIRSADGASGRILWTFDPEVTKVAGHRMRAAWGSRGLALDNGSIYTATHDGRLIALNANTGKPRWSVQTLEKGDARYITGAPTVFDDKVIIGHGGADFGVVRGYVTAYDAKTGHRLWRFYTVPGNPAKGFENDAMAMAAKTWTGEWWKFGGGGTVWHSITYDKEFDTIYLGTGNGQPWNYKIRSPGGGDNLFLASVVALDAKTGQYKWHYQENPAESWDYNSTMDIELGTLNIGGRERKVLMHAPKNGFFYVIDRETGKLISAEKFVNATWAERVDRATGRPVEAPNIRYENGHTVIWPGSAGGHNWQAMAYSPNTGLVYIPSLNLAGDYDDRGLDTKHWSSSTTMQASFGIKMPIPDIPPEAGNSYLQAWDPVAQKEVWRVPNVGLFNGGVAVTAANLVFQGQLDGRFVAYAAESGKPLWSFDAQAGIVGSPISFTAHGRQYVAVLAGLGSSAGVFGSASSQFKWDARTQRRRVLVFALDGQATLPPLEARAPFLALSDPKFKSQPTVEERGAYAYGTRCFLCHGVAAVASGSAPDLRYSPLILNRQNFLSVVRDGSLVSRGMPRFEEIPEQEFDEMRQYLRSRNHENAAAPGGPAQ